MLKIAPVFSNHMVLQREKSVLVWGECDSDKVTITINGIKTEAKVMDHHFEVKLLPMAAGGPYSMRVTSDTETVTFEDVMIGEVWLAGGQSNMELELQNSFEAEKELSTIADENVRYYGVSKIEWVGKELEQQEAKSCWKCADGENSKTWSAVAYYFAKKISRQLGITVGIVSCNWGGTSASCWVSEDVLRKNSMISSYINEYDEIVKNQDFEEYLKEMEEYRIYQTEFEKNVSHYYETCEHPTWDEAISLFGENKYPGPMGPRSFNRPAGLYESMLSRIVPYTLGGVIYYQGEEDDHKPNTYYELLSALIRKWRADFRDDSLPFMLVQLPVFQNEGEMDYKNWPFIREAQMRAFQTIKNTGIAVILENGEYGNIHPTHKKVVGDRLALQALYSVYGFVTKKMAFGPIYKSSYTDQNEMRIQFENCADGFITDGELTGFEVAAADQKYYPAKCEIRGNELVLQSDNVEAPEYARYCWTNYQQIHIFGKNGIPVAPFRTSYLDGSAVTGSRLSNEGVM